MPGDRIRLASPQDHAQPDRRTLADISLLMILSSRPGLMHQFLLELRQQ